MSIEQRFDVAFVAGLALREKQIQQNYRPIIAVHKWFARRPGTLFRALLLAEFGAAPIRELFYQANDLTGIRVADPFMGGGTPLIEANRLGCDVLGYDINPMAWWIVRQEIEHLDLDTYRQAAGRLLRTLERRVGHLYRTTCCRCGAPGAFVKYFLWVKTQGCKLCGRRIDLFPGYLLAGNSRHPKNVLVCPACGELTEAADLEQPGHCHACRTALRLDGPAKGGRCPCPYCKAENRYPDPAAGPPRHRMFGIEYHCPGCKPAHKGRFFKKADEDDLSRYEEAASAWSRRRPAFVPDDEIPRGDETDRLHRWGYRAYHEMFNERQLLGLDISAQEIARQPDERVRNALATNLSDLLRYQNMLCRYDVMALKSLDVFSVHGFPVGPIQCESNLLGISGGAGGSNVGSGGWTNILDKYARAKAYCDEPFEVCYERRKKTLVPIAGEWIGDRKNGGTQAPARQVVLRCGSATEADLAPGSLDAVLTDPPYFGNVQYAELMDFCYVWLRRLVGSMAAPFRAPSTRSIDELTGNATMDRGLGHFAGGLSQVFSRMAVALKPGRPLAFTFHHNTLEAYHPVAVAILDAGLACTAALPCPAEMAASIHINGTGSSVVDTVFVCRSPAPVPRRRPTITQDAVVGLVARDLDLLRQGGVKPTRGDARCILFGQLARLAVEHLRSAWDRAAPVEDRLARVAAWLSAWGDTTAVEEQILDDLAFALGRRSGADQVEGAEQGTADDVPV